MSQENVEIMRATLDTFARNDVPGFLRFVDPEVHLEPQLTPLQGSYVGHDGARGFFADAWETLEVLQVHYPDVRDLGDRVLALGTLRIAGEGSGIDAEIPFAIVARFRGGLITHLKDYGGDKDQALEAVGLSE
jgi:ketosteroid isomerase-like protein